MKRREFITNTALATLGTSLLFSPLSGFSLASNDEFKLPDFLYPYDALEPFIDKKTMQTHYEKHHAGYVKNLNAALQTSHLKGKSLLNILSTLENTESDLALRNNGGGHYNHTQFWETMTPGGSPKPSMDFLAAIIKDFNSFDQFSRLFIEKATKHFGSGWAWLCLHENKKLFISSTPNQDNPLMRGIVSEFGIPLLGIDVWEHAYYLQYQNKRSEYIVNFMKLINWDIISKRYTAALKTK
ncbi:MAG: superoxide dismutase [Chitinophagaceae bacterium]